MGLQEDFYNALREAVRQAGSQVKLAAAAGMQQGRISDYLTKRYNVTQIKVSTLQKLFPRMSIDYFGRTSPMNNAIANGASSVAVIGDRAHVMAGQAASRWLDRDALESRFLAAEEFTAEERIKILKFLKKEIK